MDRDRRMGVTLIARVRPDDSQPLKAFLDRSLELEPDLYVYPPSDWHVTVLSIISCDEEFSLADFNAEPYIKLIRDAANGMRSFTIGLKGITASPSCVMLQGWPSNPNLDSLRSNLRTALAASGLHSTADTRYFLQTAHSTIIRYRCPLRQPDRFRRWLVSCRDTDFSAASIGQLSLTVNNWYMTHSISPEIASFDLDK